MEQNKITATKPTRQQAVDGLLAQLPTMERKALLKLWRDLFGLVPSPALRREMLIPMLAYRMQEKVFGGLKKSTVRKLRELAEESTVGIHRRLRPKTGTRYVREHDGQRLTSCKLLIINIVGGEYSRERTPLCSLTGKNTGNFSAQRELLAVIAANSAAVLPHSYKS